jgi:chromate transport protein ChrA
MLDLASMRELAHISAQAAIRSFEKARATRQALNRLPVLLVSLLCGVFLLYTAVSSSQSLIYLATAAAFVIALDAGWHAVRPLLDWRATAQTAEEP